MAPHDKQSQITEGVLIAAIPVLGYGLAFLYELGYASHFRIPREMINVGLVQVFLAISALFMIVMILFILSDFVYSIAANVVKVDRNDPVVRSLFRILPSGLLLAAFLVVYRSYWLGWTIALVLGVLFAFLEFVVPLITQRGVQGYRAKLEEQRRHDQTIKTLPGAIGRKWGVSRARAFCFFLLFVCMAFFAGHGEAVNKQYFHVLANQKNEAIARIYGDTVVAVTYDAVTKELSGEISVQTLSPGVSFLLKQEKVGPLRRGKVRVKGVADKAGGQKTGGQDTENAVK